MSGTHLAQVLKQLAAWQQQPCHLEAGCAWRPQQAVQAAYRWPDWAEAGSCTSHAHELHEQLTVPEMPVTMIGFQSPCICHRPPNVLCVEQLHADSPQQHEGLHT